MKLIVGLGNPGKQYEGTRHNMGFIVVDEWAHQHHERFNRQAMKGDYLETRVNGEKVIVVKPTTFMNLSGDCVDSFMRYYKIPKEDVLIVYDDMDLVPGKLRFRPKGSAGGHNGMKDIIKRVGTSDIQRLKVGVGHPEKKSVVNHVLSRFPEELHPTMLAATETAVRALDEWLAGESFAQVMNRYNG